MKKKTEKREVSKVSQEQLALTSKELPDLKLLMTPAFHLGLK